MSLAIIPAASANAEENALRVNAIASGLHTPGSPITFAHAFAVYTRGNLQLHEVATHPTGVRPFNVHVNQEPYPATVAECIDMGATFLPAAFQAVIAFAKSKPFRGDETERWQKFAALHVALCDAYGVYPTLHRDASAPEAHSGGSFFSPGPNAITLSGRLSVLTYLHEFGHARGYGEKETCHFSINLFRRTFPISFAKLVSVGHTLVRREDAPGATQTHAAFNALAEVVREVETVEVAEARLHESDGVSVSRHRPARRIARRLPAPLNLPANRGEDA